MSLSVFIIVLHYRGRDDTRQCLASLGQQANAHTLVIDNGGVEPLGADFSVAFPWAEFLALPENLGWSGGNNAGIKLALERNYDLVCLLNNDTVLPQGAMARLAETAASLGPCGLHPAIDYYDAGEGAQLDPAIPQPPGLIVLGTATREGVYDIAFINGACVMFHADVLRRIGLIDERYFLLCEDADLGQRARDAGYHVYCDISVRIRHKESRAFGGRRTPLKSYYSTRNLLLFGATHGEPLPRRLRGFAWALWGTAEASGAALHSWWGLLRWSLSGAIFARAARMGVRDYLLGRFGKINTRDEQVLAPHPPGAA